MYELAESREPDRPDKQWPATVCAAFALALGLIALVAFSIYDVDRVTQPSDEELAANFSSHEAGFAELVEMLTADSQHPAAKGEASIDLATVARLTTSATRFRAYEGLLRQIAVHDFRYFPDSGKLVLVPDGEGNPEQPSKSYLYLPHAHPQTLTRYHGYMWRGPGSYIVAGDHRLKESWFIHHDMTVKVAISPY